MEVQQPQHPVLQFTDVANTRGLQAYRNKRGQGSGLCAVDFDDDGDIDIFVPQAEGKADQLYVNSGEGFFTDQAGIWGVNRMASSRTALFFDIDNDQDLDLLVANDDEDVASTFTLYRRDPTRFVDITSAAGLIKAPIVEFSPLLWSGMAAGDLNNDGFLDFVSGQWLGPTHVFFNNGDGTFSDVTNTCGMSPFSRYVDQPVIYDFNHDGWQDVFLANDFDPNELWINQRNGTFVDVAPQLGMNNAMNDMGVALGDYDNDGDLDIYITNIYGTSPPEYNVLYRNDTSGDTLRFAEVSEEAGVRDGGWGWGTTWLDVDRDGNLDLAATNGFNNESSRQDTSVFFWNPNGDIPFIEEAAIIGFDDAYWGSCLLAADFDRDGDLDVLQNCLESSLTSPRLRLLDNELAFPVDQYNWLVVRPRIDGPNHYAIGAVVRVTASGKNMMRLITAGTSYLGQEPAEAFFGVHQATVADVRIEWPDGYVTEVESVAINQVLDVLRPASLVPTVSVLAASASASGTQVEWQIDGVGSNLPVSIQRAEGAAAWQDVATSGTDDAGRVSYADADVVPGTTYRYRLAFDLGPNHFELGEVSVRVPGMELALTSVSPNPTPGGMVISFELPSNAPAKLELLDLFGRKWRTMDVGGMGAGAHLVDLAAGLDLPPALYVVRLTSSGRSITRKVSVVP